MLRRLLSGIFAAALLMLTVLTISAAPAAASHKPGHKNTCPKDGSSQGNQYPPGQCKAQTNRSTVEQGGQVQASGNGYDDNEQVEAGLNSVYIKLSTLTASAKGVASQVLTIPLNAPLGDHTISLYGLSSGRYLTAQIRVVPRALPRTDTGVGAGGGSNGGTIGGLPRTGAMVAGLGLAGAGAVALGAGLVVAGRRRRQVAGA